MEVLEKRIAQLVALIGLLVTLVVTPFWNFDPINPAKVLICATLSFSAIGMTFSNRALRERLDKKLLLVSGLFVAWMLCVLVFSGAPKSQQLWGMFGRNTGIVAYISLVVLMIASSTISKDQNIAQVAKCFVLVATLEVMYGFIQLMGQDPIAWSQNFIFGTLGNVNFLSAFLGMSATYLVVQMFSLSYTRNARLFFGFLVLCHTFILYKNGSIQGILMFLIGISIFIFSHIKQSKLRRRNHFLVGYIFSALIALFLVLLGILRKGPLAGLLFQETLLFRIDYWRAGWNMTISNPLFGVGIDSYGDWYRAKRTLEATLRTGPDRTANSAHNIFLDISSGGGFPLLFIYLALMLLGFRTVLRSIVNFDSSSRLSCMQLGISLSWLVYQVQALISINQIGVGVWNWIFLGILISMGQPGRYAFGAVQREQGRKQKRTKKLADSGLIPATSLIAAATLGLAGLALALPPQLVDMQFKNALNSRSFDGMKKVANSRAANAWHLIQIVEAAARSGLNADAIAISQDLVRRFPRDFSGWKAVAAIPGTPPELATKALMTLKDLDPHNPLLR